MEGVLQPSEKNNNQIKLTMKLHAIYIIILLPLIILCSCSVIEKSSRHGFENGYYTLNSENHNDEKVYVEIENEEITVYRETENQLENLAMMNIPLVSTDSLYRYPLLFTKKSADIDITTILLKYRPAVSRLPAQLNTDFNVALFAGLRKDNYHFHYKKDPPGRYRQDIIQRGYDFGIFAGPGTTLIGPFATTNLISYEYVGMILQFGLAGFIESNVASFGLAAGYDYLASPDRGIWIYNKKPWFCLIIGIALN